MCFVNFGVTHQIFFVNRIRKGASEVNMIRKRRRKSKGKC